MTHRLCALILFSVVTFHVSVIQADEALEASGLCYKIQNFINALANYTDTLCIPALGQQGITKRANIFSRSLKKNMVGCHGWRRG
jgi:hypothetical protein